MRHHLRPLLILAALAIPALFHPAAASAFQAGVKVGWHAYNSSEFLDTIEAEGVDGLNREFFVDLGVLPMVTLEISYGANDGEASIDAGDDTAGTDASLDVSGSYILLTPKVHVLPGTTWDLYAGAGIGYYYVRGSIDSLPEALSADDETTVGYHATLGLGYYLSKNLVLIIEARYARANVSGLGELADSFDAGGITLHAGGALAW